MDQMETCLKSTSFSITMPLGMYLPYFWLFMGTEMTSYIVTGVTLYNITIVRWCVLQLCLLGVLLPEDIDEVDMALSNMIPIIVGRWNIRAEETVKSHCVEPKEDDPHGDMEALLPMQQVPMKCVEGKGLHLTHENKWESMKGSLGEGNYIL